MIRKARSSLWHTLSLAGMLSSILTLAILGFFFIITPRDVPPMQSLNLSTRPTSQPPSPTPASDPTANWKTFSDNRPNIDFGFKYPPRWNDPSYHCNTPPNPKNLDLSPNCIQTVIFTDQIDQFSNDDGRDLVVISEAQLRINGYKAVRQIFSTSLDSEIPDTYELWVYDAFDQPFFLYVAWIGAGTDKQTAEQFVQILDREIRTLQLRRH